MVITNKSQTQDAQFKSQTTGALNQIYTKEASLGGSSLGHMELKNPEYAAYPAQQNNNDLREGCLRGTPPLSRLFTPSDLLEITI